MLLPHTALSRGIEPFIARIGRITGWLWMILLAVIIANVTLRYVVGEGYVQLEELQWHLYATGFLLGIAYALQTDSHIRVDVLHERWSARTQAWVELYGILLLLLPFIALILLYAIPFAWSSYVMNEISQAPGGLPMRWIIKAMLPLGFALLLLATLSRLSRIWVFLFFRPDYADEPSNAGSAHDR